MIPDMDDTGWGVALFYGLATLVISTIVFLSGWALGAAWGWW